jgi:lipopolysaccharide export system permease protein
MSLLGRYLLREVVVSGIFVFFALMALFSFFDLVQELGSLSRGDYHLGKAALYVLLNVPGHVHEILPIAGLVGSLLALSRLVLNSELSVMQASGLSVWRIARYLAMLGVGLAMLALVNGELVAPWTEQAAQRLKLKATEALVVQQFRSGLWVKDGESFVNVRQITPDAQLRDVRIYDFAPDGELLTSRRAVSASWEGEQRWRLDEVTTTQFSAGGVRVSRQAAQDWRSVLSPGILAVLLISPEKMATRTLLQYIDHLKANRQNAARYEMALWTKMFFPIAIPVMMLLALPFVFQAPRSGGLSSRVFMGILAGLVFYLINRLVSYAGLVNDWPPVLTAAAPSVFFMLVALLSLRWATRR